MAETMKKTAIFCIAFLVCEFGFISMAGAVDSEQSRRTLSGIRGVLVVVEDYQPHMKMHERFLEQAGIRQGDLKRECEAMLKQSGIKVVEGAEWLKTPGRPVLYIAINTHEIEKYHFAYDTRLELQQLAILETNPSVKTMAMTWSMNMTGNVDIGHLSALKGSVMQLLSRFIRAHQSARK
jgi:hypothetical protein